MVRAMGVAPPRSKRVAPSVDADLPSVDDAEVSGVHALHEEEEEVHEEWFVAAKHRCFFAPKQPAIDTNSAIGDATMLVDLLTDSIISSSIVDDAALELDADRCRLPSAFVP